MTEAIREGLQLGLTGSDLVDHMSDVADGINAWKSTGMPMNKEALQTFKAGAAGLGLGSIRGGAVGKGLMQGIQGIGQRGIKSAADLFFATEVGGLKGMGPDEVLEAQIAMEQLKKGEGGKEMSTRALGALRKLAEAGGGGIWFPSLPGGGGHGESWGEIGPIGAEDIHGEANGGGEAQS